MKKSLKITIQIQANFRPYLAFTKKQAQFFGVEGTIKLVDPKKVIIHACGHPEKLDDFIDSLYDGASPSPIDDLFTEPLINARDFRGTFRIIEN